MLTGYTSDQFTAFSPTTSHWLNVEDHENTCKDWLHSSLPDCHQTDDEKGKLGEVPLLTVDISDLLRRLSRDDLELHHGPGGPAHHAGVVPGVGVGGARDVEARLSARHQEISSNTARER